MSAPGGTPPMEGVIPILLTPFDEQGRIDPEGLEREVEFVIGAGVHALGIALGSEVFKLTEGERDLVARTVIRAVNGRIPVVVNTGADGTDLAIAYSRAAEAAGADALMVIPPHFMPVGPAEIADHYQRLDAAVGIPIILQDIPQAPVGPGLALRIADACRNVRAIKVETPPVTTRVAETVALVGERLTVIGGAGGGYLIEELRRGSRGTMPFPSQPAAFVAIWDRVGAGDLAGAREVFESTIAPVLRLGSQAGDLFYHVNKQLLVRLGVFRTAVVRAPTTAIDAITQREIDELLERLTA
jgi:4-hydroxy-tetrahydrodipicolinate synthase